jgi:long-chain acyl-CoA synthetase
MTQETISALIAEAHTSRAIPPGRRLVSYKNIGNLLRERAGSLGEKEWLIYYPDDRGEARVRYSYKRFYEDIARCASYLQSLGVTRGDKVATFSFNHPDTVIQYFGALSLGAVVVPLNVGEDDKRTAFIIGDSRPRVILHRDQFAPRVREILATVPQGEARPVGEGEFHRGISAHTAEFPSGVEAGPDDEALIVYTSGTTGHPKGVVLTQYNLLVDARAIAEWHGLTSEERIMCVLPIHHVNGTVVTLITPLYAGGSVVLNRRFHSESFFERAAAENVNVASVVPTLLQFLLHEYRDRERPDLSALRYLICGAGPLTVELASRFEQKFGIPVIHGYGLSETTCYSCFLPHGLTAGEHRHWMADFGFPSIGLAIPPNEMAIHDAGGRECEEGARGEIVIRGHNVMKCYYANPAANEAAFTHGWFRSGDEGFFRRDSSGRSYFFITGRIKELIIRGGANVSPFEIDEVLMNMPGVKAGLAVGFENDWYGEEVGAYVQPSGREELTPERVIDYCRKFLPFQKCPKVVLFGDDIPVTSTGKYQRVKLRPLFEKWKSVQFSESARGRDRS